MNFIRHILNRKKNSGPIKTKEHKLQYADIVHMFEQAYKLNLGIIKKTGNTLVFEKSDLKISVEQEVLPPEEYINTVVLECWEPVEYGRKKRILEEYFSCSGSLNRKVRWKAEWMEVIFKLKEDIETVNQQRIVL